MTLKSAVWFTTMACNFKCKYCWEVQAQERGEFKPEKFKPAKDWIDAWMRLKPKILDITGGEPFLQPGLLDIIETLTKNGTNVAMTSNFSHPILDFVRRINHKDIFSLTASYHPSENGTRQHPMNQDVFFGRLLLLKEFGFAEKITVNIVTWPEQLWLVPEFIERCEKYGFRWHIDPYSSIAYYPWEYTDAEKQLIAKYVTEQRKPIEDKSPVLCSGGIDHISVQPNGSAWRCILERQQFLNPLGNIFDPDFSLLDNHLRCDQRHICPGCDRDKVNVVKISETT